MAGRADHHQDEVGSGGRSTDDTNGVERTGTDRARDPESQGELLGLAALERVCLWMTPFAYVGMTANVARAAGYGGWISTPVQYGILTAILVVLLLRRRLPPLARISVYSGGLVAFGLVGLAEWGLAGQGLLVIVFGLILASLYGVRVWIMVQALAVTGTVAVAAGYISGALPVRVDAAAFLQSPLAWATGVVTLNLAGGTALIAYQLTRQLMQRTDALQLSEQRFRDIFDASSDGILILDAETGEILDVNQTVLDTYGITRGDKGNLAIRDVTADLPDFSVANAQGRLREADKGELVVFDWMAKCRNGDTFPVEVVLKKTHIGGREGILATVRDISDRKEAEEQMRHLETQLRQAQKLEAVGQLAGGVAHDFNNLLQAILGYTTLTLESLDEEEVVRENLDEIRDAAKRAATLTRQLLAFSRRQILEPIPLDLNDIVAGLMKMLRRVLGEHIDFHLTAGRGLGTVRADRGQVEQILMNLCVNARDAMPDGGRLTIETKNVTLDEAYCQENTWASPGAYVVVSVADTGHGMDEDTQMRVFEPFFTTKGPGEGTGLGLSMVYGIVRQHDGLVNVYSEPGQGTEFKIYLPRLSEDAEHREDESGEAEPVGGTETILLAEDEPQVRKLAVRVLTDAGYRVLAAEDGEAALHIAEKHDGEIALAVLDVVMPKLGGRELRERLWERDPDLPVLFASGYSTAVVQTNFMLEAGVHLIAKPYDQAELLTRVRSLLDERKGPGE